MTKGQLSRLSVDLNNLFYRLFDQLTIQEKDMLIQALETVREAQKGDF